MSSFKLNLKPAHAFANAASEQNAVDAATREAEAEERLASTSPSRTDSLNASKNGHQPQQQQPHVHTTTNNKSNKHADPNEAEATTTPSGGGGGAKPPALRLGRITSVPETTSDGDEAEEEDATRSSKPSTAKPTATTNTNAAAPAPSIGIPGLRLGANGGSAMNSARGSARENSSAKEAGGSSNASPLNRKSTSGAGQVQQQQQQPQQGGSGSAAKQPAAVPAFSIQLSKLNVGGSRTSAGGGQNSAGTTHRTAGPSDSPRGVMAPFTFSRYNPEIEKPVAVDEEDDFLTSIEDLGTDAKALKEQLVNARRELLVWDFRFEAMRDHYHDHVTKLVAHMEHEQEHQERLHNLNTHGFSIHSAHGTAHTAATNRSESSNADGDTTRSLGMSPRRQLYTNTARGPSRVDMAVQTDITIDVLEVMIKYPGSIRGERGNTRASSPAITGIGRKSTGSKTKSPAATALIGHAGRIPPSPSASVGGTATSTSLATARRSPAATPTMRASRVGDKGSDKGSGTPMSRSFLSAGGSLSTGRPSSGAFNPSASGSGQTTLHTARARNSALLSVNSEVSRRPVTGASAAAATPRALMTSRGLSPAASVTARLTGSSPGGPTTAATAQQADRTVHIPPTLGSSSYVKPGSRKFVGVSAASPLNSTAGGPTTTRGHLATSRHHQFESSVSSQSRGGAASDDHHHRVDPLSVGDFGSTTGGLSGYDPNSAAGSPLRLGRGSSPSSSAAPSPFASRAIIRTNGSKYPPVAEHLPNRKEAKEHSTASQKSFPSAPAA